MTEALSNPPPALVDSVANLTLNAFQMKAGTEGMKLSARDRAMLLAGAECAVGLTWGAIVQRAEQTLCTCPDIGVFPAPDTVKGLDKNCPVHGKPVCTCRYVNQGLPDEAHAVDKDCPVHGAEAVAQDNQG